MRPRAPARLTASPRLWSPRLVYSRAARSLAADREMPRLSAITVKRRGPAGPLGTVATAVVIDAAPTQATASPVATAPTPAAEGRKPATKGVPPASVIA